MNDKANLEKDLNKVRSRGASRLMGLMITAKQANMNPVRSDG